MSPPVLSLRAATRGNTCNFFLYIYHIKCDISKITKKYLLRPDDQTLELLLTSVKLSSFHIRFRWDRPRTSQEKS